MEISKSEIQYLKKILSYDVKYINVEILSSVEKLG